MSGLTENHLFTTERKAKYVSVLRETGEKVIARREVTVTSKTIAHHRKIDPEFAEAEAEALRLYGAEKIGAEIHRRAIVGTDEPVYYKDSVVGYKKVFSDRLLIEHARRHLPAYRDKSTIHQKVTGKVTHGMEDLAKLSPESREDLKRILERETNGGPEKEANQEE